LDRAGARESGDPFSPRTASDSAWLRRSVAVTQTSDCETLRIAVAAKLGVSVVVERVEGKFELLNPEVSPALTGVFPSAAIAHA
jgi:hypothetical protein